MQEQYLSGTCAIPHGKVNKIACDTRSAIPSRQVITRYGSISKWALSFSFFQTGGLKRLLWWAGMVAEVGSLADTGRHRHSSREQRKISESVVPPNSDPHLSPAMLLRFFKGNALGKGPQRPKSSKILPSLEARTECARELKPP